MGFKINQIYNMGYRCHVVTWSGDVEIASAAKKMIQEVFSKNTFVFIEEA